MKVEKQENQVDEITQNTETQAKIVKYITLYLQLELLFKLYSFRHILAEQFIEEFEEKINTEYLNEIQ